ncbi:uncharacterized protein [Typha angustifolia]
MARWDEILTLPVQNPPTLEFSAAEITWSRVEGWRESMDRLALIPFSRVNDFVRGESNKKECPTRFHVEARRRRPLEMAYKPKVDGILEYILYWCSFGPDDHRKGGVIRPSRNYAAKRKTPAGRPNTKRGCVCHFIVKRLIAEPSVALIIYNQDKHVDRKGLPCHGPMDKKAVGTRAMFAPYISDELRLQIMSLLYVGVPVETIMQRHSEMVEKQGGPCNRDDLLTHRYVRRIERKIRRSTYELDIDDATSIDLWVENHRDHIFLYEDFSSSGTFLLGIQTEWQLQQMIHFGNRSLLASDSKFGTNKLKYPIYSLLVFDSYNNAIPIAWIITPNFANGEIHRWMGALYDRVHMKDPTWQLGGFIVDDPLADLLTIREVFQCSILISFWRVRHAWHKSLLKKCSETDVRVAMARQLGLAVSNICRGSGDLELFEAFLEDFVDCSDFLDYFKAVWFPRIGAWISALKALPFASAEVSAAIESYHHLLKLRLLNENDTSLYQRADWLVDKLGTKVHSYYWLDEYAGKDNFSRYWRDEWKSGLTPWRQGLLIPDLDVALEGKCAKVVCQTNKEKLHTVLNPGSEFAMCDCSWSRMGNICKHVTKLTKVYRDRGLAAHSTSLFDYNQTLRNTLYCSPHDSVIRDHAIGLAVCVRTQLNALPDQNSVSCSSTPSVPGKQQTANELRAISTQKPEYGGTILMNNLQSLPVKGNETLRNERCCDAEDMATRRVTNDYDKNALLWSHESSIESLPTELRWDNNASVRCGCLENESGNSLDQNNNSEYACSNQISIDVATSGQIGNGCRNNSEAEEMIDINLQSHHGSPPTLNSGTSNSVSKERLTHQVSNVPSDALRVGEIALTYYDPMIIETIEVNTAVCDGSEKKSLEVHNILQGTVGNGGDRGVTVETTEIKHIAGCDIDKVVGTIVSNRVLCDPILNEEAGTAKTVLEMDLGPCSADAEASIADFDDGTKDVVLAEQEVFRHVMKEFHGGSNTAPEETTCPVQMAVDLLTVKPAADQQCVVMEVDSNSDV